MTTRPPEHEVGQDDEAPDLRQALLVSFRLLSDISDRFDPGVDDSFDDDDLRLRAQAVRKVLYRLWKEAP